MAIQFLNTVNFNGNQAEGLTIQNAATDPASGQIGQLYYNTSADELRAYDGSDWNEVGGGVESVGLQMPSAFTVTNSPVTSTGTLTVAGAGNTTQYIRGDGSLATFPSIPTVPSNIVETLTVASGTYVSLTDASSADGNVDLGTVDLSASNGNSTTASRFLTKDNTWAVPSYTSNTNETYTLPVAAGASNTAVLNLTAGGSGSGIKSSVTIEGTDKEIVVSETAGNNGTVTFAFPGGGFTAPDGSSATTQSNSDNSTKLATTAYVDSMIATVPAGLVFKGSWNANTNTPTLTSGQGTVGNYYIVSVAGNTNLDGITDWAVGDWAVFTDDGAGGADQWDKIDNSSILDGAGVAGQVAYWSGTKELAGDGGMTYDATTDVLTVNGQTSTEWTEAYDNYVASAAVTGSSTKTMTFTQNDGGTFTAQWTDEDSGGTVTDVLSTSPITIDGTAGGSNNLKPDIGILTATKTQIGAAAVTDGTGIDVSVTNGIFTISTDGTNPLGTRISLNTSTSGVSQQTGAPSGTTGWVIDVTDNNVFGNNVSDAIDVKVEVVTSAGATVYPDITRSNEFMTINFTNLPSAPGQGDYEALLTAI